MKDKWLKDLKNRMSDFEMDTPDGLWAQIEAAEAARGTMRKRRRFVYLKRAAAVAAVILLILSAGLYLNFNTPHIDIKSMAVEKYIADSHKDEYLDNAISAEQPEVIEPIRKTAGSTAFAAKEDIHPAADSVVSAKADIVEPEQILEEISEPESLNLKDLDKSGSSFGRQYAMNEPGQKRGGHRMSVSVFSAGGVGSNSAYSSISSGAMGMGSDGVGWGDSPLLGILLFNKGNVLVTEYKHRQPVRFGVSFTFRLTDRLGLGTGLTYTGLTSDFRSGSQAHHIRGRQKLDYIGIPINVTYDFLRWKRLQLYGAVGVLGEQCVYAKTKTSYMIDGANSGADNKDVKGKPFQLSVNASLGLQFNVVSAVGVYAEPGVSYYFNDGSDLMTIYKDRPVNFNLNLGVRITFDSMRSKP